MVATSAPIVATRVVRQRHVREEWFVRSRQEQAAPRQSEHWPQLERFYLFIYLFIFVENRFILFRNLNLKQQQQQQQQQKAQQTTHQAKTHQVSPAHNATSPSIPRLMEIGLMMLFDLDLIRRRKKINNKILV